MAFFFKKNERLQSFKIINMVSFHVYIILDDKGNIIKKFKDINTLNRYLHYYWDDFNYFGNKIDGFTEPIYDDTTILECYRKILNNNFIIGRIVSRLKNYFLVKLPCK